MRRGETLHADVKTIIHRTAQRTTIHVVFNVSVKPCRDRKLSEHRSAVAAPAEVINLLGPTRKGAGGRTDVGPSPATGVYTSDDSSALPSQKKKKRRFFSRHLPALHGIDVFWRKAWGLSPPSLNNNPAKILDH